MNLFKKLMTGVAVGALTLTVAGLGSVSADAAKGDVTIDVEKQTLTVQSTDSSINEVFVAYPAVKNGAAKAVKSWDIYEADEDNNVVIDVSNLSATKDNYVLVKTSAGTKLIKFQAVNTKLKGAYDAIQQDVVFENATEAATYQFRTASGTWADYAKAEAGLSKFEMTGATVYFREKPKSSISSEESVTIADIEGALTPQVASFGGKELKVKITKSANGPKATINLENGTFKIAKAGVQYRNADTGKWQDATTEKNQEIKVDLSKDGVFEVRTAVIDADKKAAGDKAATDVKTAKATKPVSKITQYTYVAQKNVTITANDDVKEATSEELAFDYVVDKKGNITLQVKNTGAADYQVVIAAEEKEDADLTADTKTYKPTAVKAGKTAKIKVTEGQVVYVRYASNKKTGDWASKYVKAGKVVAPKAEEPSPSPEV